MAIAKRTSPFMAASTKPFTCYPAEHHAYWKKRLPGRDLPFGAFGENFTTEGMLEENVRVGDRFAINDAEVVVTQPRLPCYKLSAFVFKQMTWSRNFSRGDGSVSMWLATREGEVAAFDEIIPVTAINGSGVSIRRFSEIDVPGETIHEGRRHRDASTFRTVCGS